MRIALILHGNLRTFFMYVNDTDRVCDILIKNVVDLNSVDVFASTDTNDYYLDNVHYFNPAFDRIENNTRYHDIINFVSDDDARQVITTKLQDVFGHRLKSLSVNNYSYEIDEKLSSLIALNSTGSNLFNLVQQYKKIYDAYDLLKIYEHENFINYDIIIKTRFDNLHNDAIDISVFDFDSYDIFVPGVNDAPLVHDWGAVGTRSSMDKYLELYNMLGFVIDDRLYRCECKGCGVVTCGKMISCTCANSLMIYDELTMSSEYHLYKLFKDNNIKYTSVNASMSPYRFT